MLTPPFSAITGINQQNFADHAIALQQFQRQHIALYRDFCGQLSRTERLQPNNVPFLPISFFKTHRLIREGANAQIQFSSSGTTGLTTSTHFVADEGLYVQSFLTAFKLFYGDPKEYCILGLLPSYLERSGSSLVYMVDHLIKESAHPLSGFFLQNQQRLAEVLAQLEAQGQRTLLIGVTYALLDFATSFPMPLRHTIIMETGGMKGRRKEMLREEVHALLKRAFQVERIHSEYGMTELLSQAYATENGRFVCPPWMKIFIRSEDDPLQAGIPTHEKPITGAINIVDLANIWSIAFIATDDLGRLYPDGSFEVLGRMDNSDVRGCSLLAL